MYRDVLELARFYQGPIGQVARRMIRRRIRYLWPRVTGEVVVGLGYAAPYLRPFREEAQRVLALMPAGQGVIGWPPEGPNQSALVDETELPLPDLSVDRVLLVHGLEGTEHVRQMMREIWRVLVGGGRVLAVVPNRRGLWAAAEWTPFGHGHPYSTSQLRALMADSLFVPDRTEHALFVPPVRSRFALAWAPAWEELGRRWFRVCSGVTLVEATKQAMAGVAQPATASSRRRIVPIADGASPVGLLPPGSVGR